MADPKFAAMAKQLMALHDDKKYAEFLRQQSLAGDHSFLLTAIEHSNLHPSVRRVLEELITQKLRRPKHRPKSDDTDLKNVIRALRVLDLEAEGWNKRDAAIEEAKKQLHCSYNTIEKALQKYEVTLKGSDQQLLEDIRSVIK
jgi:hypothetical protein